MSSTPMEKIKAYQSIKAFLNEDQRATVAEMLQLEEEDLTRRLEGKEAEYEFLLRCYFLEQIKDVVAFEEGISRLTETKTADFLFVTKEDRRLAIEVKSTKDESWKVSPKVFKEKKEFADLINAELYFAIKLKGYWLFLSGDYIKKKNFRIKLENSLLDSQLNILGEKGYIIGNSIRILSTYSRDAKRSIGIENPDYGYLERYSIEVGNKKVLRITPSSKHNIFISIVLEAIQDSASNHYQKIQSLGKGKTLIIEELNENSQFYLSHILIAPIKHLMSDFKFTYDFSSYVTNIVDTKNNVKFNEDLVQYVLGLFCKAGVKIYEVRGKKLYELQLLD